MLQESGTKEAEMANNLKKEKPAKLEEESRQRDAGGKSILARGKLGVRSSIEVGEGNFCVAQAGEQGARRRLFGPLSRLDQGVKVAREPGCGQSSSRAHGAVTAYPGAA